MITLDEKAVDRLFAQIDVRDYYHAEPVDYSNFEDRLKALIDANVVYEQKAVVGIDIYRYSQYGKYKQTLIPMVFDLILEQAEEWCRTDESAFFHEYDFASNFITPAMADSWSLIIRSRAWYFSLTSTPSCSSLTPVTSIRG